MTYLVEINPTPATPHAPCEWIVPACDVRTGERAHDHVNHLWESDHDGRTDGYIPRVAVVAVHPLDAAFPAPEGTVSAREYVARVIAMAAHPSGADAPESPRVAWCNWYGCETVAAPARCVWCGDFHPRGLPRPDLRNYA